MRILQVDNLKSLTRIMRDIHVDPYGIRIMRLKGIMHLIKLNSISNVAANILKQEMLSLGGDVAVSRNVLTGKSKKTDCLVMGNLSQINRLNYKLNRQPFGLSRLGFDISQAIENYQKDNFALKLGGYKLNLSRRTHIMGIINLTPDSFSADGFYKSQKLEVRSQKSKNKEQKNLNKSIIEYVSELVEDGADIIDVGGESTRPGAKPVSVKEEITRVKDVIKNISKRIKVPVSIDTYKPEVAKAALDNGAVIVNDITGLKNLKMRKIIARYKAGTVIMHMKGMPLNMQEDIKYADLINDIITYLRQSVECALEAGIDKDKIIIDPGIGFGKTVEHNLEIIKNLKEFKILGSPLLAGPSRKSFIGKILDVKADKRLYGTIAAAVLSAVNGADILRVHDVKEVKQALKIWEAVNNGCN